jgi:hypothetical protein
VTPALARPFRLGLESFSRTAGLHPELVVRLVRLGVLDATRGPSGDLFFAPDQVARAARVQRLRAGLTVNYAALGLVLDLLDRIEVLEAALRTNHRSNGGADRRWT